MKCRQCEETIRGAGCTKTGVCGKSSETAELQDLLIYSLSGVAYAAKKSKKDTSEAVRHIYESLFSTLTNVNFDPSYFVNKIDASKMIIKDLLDGKTCGADCADYDYKEKQEKAKTVGVESLDENADLRSLKELLLYGLKGLAAYYYHAAVLGHTDREAEEFLIKGLIVLREKHSADELTNAALECGKVGVDVMALLDSANNERYGTPEITKVNIGVRKNPGILITGHDLKDLEELLDQTKGTGVDVYTHGEMLPAHAYPFFKKYENLAGNYGNAWYHQTKEFADFNGPIVVTTNCLVPPKQEYKERLFTTGLTGFEGVKHISAGSNGKKDFSDVIDLAERCDPPKLIEDGTITTGFAHGTVLSLADTVVNAVKTGAITRFVVMAGCDGRISKRSYYTEFAEALPPSTVILTAGCAKYRYNKLPLNDIGGIPRVLDAGQCNDCYSLAVVAMKLAEVFGCGVNELPLSFNISWYEQKACLVLLSLLHLGVKDIMLGPRLPEFVTPAILDVLVKNFGMKGISDVKNDMNILNIG